MDTRLLHSVLCTGQIGTNFARQSTSAFSMHWSLYYDALVNMEVTFSHFFPLSHFGKVSTKALEILVAFAVVWALRLGKKNFSLSFLNGLFSVGLLWNAFVPGVQPDHQKRLHKRVPFAVIFLNCKTEFGLIMYFVHDRDDGETYAVMDIPKIANSPPLFSKFSAHCRTK